MIPAAPSGIEGWSRREVKSGPNKKTRARARGEIGWERTSWRYFVNSIILAANSSASLPLNLILTQIPFVI